MNRAIAVILLIAIPIGAGVSLSCRQDGADHELPTLDPATLRESEFAYRVWLSEEPVLDREEELSQWRSFLGALSHSLEHILDGVEVTPWHDRYLVIAIDDAGMEEDEGRSALDVVEHIMNDYRNIGTLEFCIVAADREGPEGKEIDLSFRTEELVALLRELETRNGSWQLDVDLSPLEFDAVDLGGKVRCKWVPLSSSTIEYEPSLACADTGRYEENETGLTWIEEYTFEKLRTSEDQTDAQIASTCFRLIEEQEDPAWRFTARDLIGIRPAHDANGGPAVAFELHPKRKDSFRRFTRIHVKRNLAIILDDEVVTDPVIQSELPGEGIISGPSPHGFTNREQKNMMRVLKSGSTCGHRLRWERVRKS